LGEGLKGGKSSNEEVITEKFEKVKQTGFRKKSLRRVLPMEGNLSQKHNVLMKAES